jgi:hypothetical protein
MWWTGGTLLRHPKAWNIVQPGQDNHLGQEGGEQREGTFEGLQVAGELVVLLAQGAGHAAGNGEAVPGAVLLQRQRTLHIQCVAKAHTYTAGTHEVNQAGAPHSGDAVI